jgi:hypothetical protein
MRVTDRCTVIIAAPESLPALRAAAPDEPDIEVLEFADTDALKALEVITNRRPAHVFVENTFAQTARGAALIKRIKADPTLGRSWVHVVTPVEAPVDGDDELSEPVGHAPADEAPASFLSAAEPSIAAALLDQWGTRRAPRYAIAGRVEMAVDGKTATLVNLSAVGAQIVSTTVLKPNQRVRVALVDAHGILRFRASVVWAAFEIDPEEGPRYRAGLDFLDADGAAVDAFGARHHQS